MRNSNAKVSRDALDSFIKKNLFEARMSSGGMDGWSNYIGHDWSGWLCGPAQSRDANALERSNYRVALDMLGGEQEGKVECRSVGHWAVGHIDQIMVKATARKAVRKLYEIKASLADYPVLDETDFSQEECDEQAETLSNNIRDFRRGFFEGLGFKNFKVDPRGERAKQVDELIDRVYGEACSYSGLENGWVTEESTKRYLAGEGRWELPRLAREGNRIARAIIAAGLCTPAEVTRAG